MTHVLHNYPIGNPVAESWTVIPDFLTLSTCNSSKLMIYFTFFDQMHCLLQMCNSVRFFIYTIKEDFHFKVVTSLLSKLHFSYLFVIIASAPLY